MRNVRGAKRKRMGTKISTFFPYVSLLNSLRSPILPSI